MSPTSFIDVSRPMLAAAMPRSVAWSCPFPHGKPVITEEMEDIGHKLKIAVAKLGEFVTADQLAAFLANQGATGSVRDSDNCVLAQWLQKAIGYRHITVGQGVAVNFGDVMGILRTPPVLREFYLNFDRGLYPALLAK